MWNMYQRTLQEDRTNDHAEAANRRLRSELEMLHPSIWNFLHALIRVQNGRDEYFKKLSTGHEPQIKVLKYRKADERIEYQEYGCEKEIIF